MTTFTESDYEKLHALVFRPDYSGYKPSVVEIPNGDGKADSEKRYAHVATKYLQTPEQRRDLMPFLEKAHRLALKAAALLSQLPPRMSLPDKYWPVLEYGALRILDYPPGAISNTHEDFDLFTLMMYRDQPGRFMSAEVDAPALQALRKVNAQAHLGQIGTEIGLGPATPHAVLASETRQKSIVYFAIPDHDMALPSGETVRAWLNRRMKASRTSFDEYT